MADMEEDSDKAHEQGRSPPSPTSNTIDQKVLNDYKYAIRTMKQAGNYNKITTYLILHIRKTDKHGRDIADAVEKQEPLNFEPSAPRLKILSIVKTVETSPQEK